MTMRGEIGDRPAVLIRVPGGTLDLPSGTHLFAFPRGVFDRLGTYHLFWAEDSNAATSRHFASSLTRLMHAALKGGKWSIPEAVLSGSQIKWGPERGSVAVDSTNQLHLAVAAELHPGEVTLSYLRLADGKWHRREFAVQAAYADVVTPAKNEALIAYIAADNGPSRGANRVFVVLSNDNGRSWKAPTELSGAGDQPAFSLHAVSMPIGVQLSWRQEVQMRRSEVLRQVITIDHGKTWRPLPDVALTRSQRVQLTVVGSSCGTTAALIESLDASALSQIAIVDEIRRGPNAFDTPLVRVMLPSYVATANMGAYVDADTLFAVGTAASANGVASTIMTQSPMCSTPQVGK
jgi:hypothetical protein